MWVECHYKHTPAKSRQNASWVFVSPRSSNEHPTTKNPVEDDGIFTGEASTNGRDQPLAVYLPTSRPDQAQSGRTATATETVTQSCPLP